MVMVVYTFLGLFNPKPTVVCSDQYIYPGSEIELAGCFKDQPTHLSSAFDLRGNRIGSYRQGLRLVLTRMSSTEMPDRCSSPDEIATGAVLIHFLPI